MATLEPITRVEQFLSDIIDQGGGGGGSGGGGVVSVHDNNGTLDKTWQEIHDAGFSVCFGVESYTICVGISSENGEYIVTYWSYGYHEPDYYVTNSASGYPVRDQG